MEKTKRYFTQRELEKHINARLIRERRKNQDLEVLKSMVDTLLGEGKINANSYAEAAKVLMAMIAGSAVGNKENVKQGRTSNSGMMKAFGDTDDDTAFEKNAGVEDDVSMKEDRMSDTVPGKEKINANSYAEAAKVLMAMIAGSAVGNKEDIKQGRMSNSDMVKAFGDTDDDTAFEKDTVNADIVSTEDDGVCGIFPGKEMINANSCAEAVKVLAAMAAEKTTVGNKEEEDAETEEGRVTEVEAVRDSDAIGSCAECGDGTARSVDVSEDYIADRKGNVPESEDVRKRGTQIAEDTTAFGASEKDGSAVGDGYGADAVSEDGGKVGDTETRLTELCRELLGILEKGAAKRKSTDNGFYARRDICSTGFSKTGSGEDMRFAQTLTPTQREIARRAGLSYREYAELLREIPENTRKRKLMR